MDKETLSHYGWIVILVLILSVLLALATPFGNFITEGFKVAYTGLFDTGNNALGIIIPGAEPHEPNTLYYYQPYAFDFGGSQTAEVVFHKDGAYDIYYAEDGYEWGEIYTAEDGATYGEGTVEFIGGLYDISEDGTQLLYEGEVMATMIPTPIHALYMNSVYTHDYGDGRETLTFKEDGSGVYTDYYMDEEPYVYEIPVGEFKYFDEYFEDHYYDEYDGQTYIDRCAVYPNGLKIINFGSVYKIDCQHLNTEIRNKEEYYTGDTYCKDCGILIEKGKYQYPDSYYSLDAYAILLDNSSDETNPGPMIFVRSETEIKVGDTYNSKTYGELPVLAVYTGFETVTTDTNNNYPTHPWPELTRAATSVVFEDSIKPLSTASWFYEFVYCKYMDLTKLDTSNVTDMTKMFMYCGTGLSEGRVSANLSALDTHNVVSMYYMFDSSHFVHLDLSSFNTRKVKNMSGMFYYASTGKVTYGPNWDTSGVLDMTHMYQYSRVPFESQHFDMDSADTSYMFRNNSMLSSITISKNVPAIGEQMFYSCSNLSTIYYEGTVSEWCALQKGNNWHYGVPATTVICSDGNSCLDCSLVANADATFEKYSETHHRKAASCSKCKGQGYVYYSHSMVMDANPTYIEDTYNQHQTSATCSVCGEDGYVSENHDFVPNEDAEWRYGSETQCMIEAVCSKCHADGDKDISHDFVPNEGAEYKYANATRCTVDATCTRCNGNGRVGFNHTGGVATCQNKAVCSLCNNEYGSLGSHIVSGETCATCGTPITIIETTHNPYPNNQSNVTLGTWDYSDAKSVTIDIICQTQSSSNDFFYIKTGNYYIGAYGDLVTYSYAWGGSSKRTLTFTTTEALTGKVIFYSNASNNNYYGIKVVITPNY